MSNYKKITIFCEFLFFSIIILLFLITSHEFGHWLAAAALGYPAYFSAHQTTVWDLSAETWHFLVIDLNGILYGNLFILILFYLFPVHRELIKGAFFVNLINFLPLPGSDGLQVLEFIWGSLTFPAVLQIASIWLVFLVILNSVIKQMKKEHFLPPQALNLHWKSFLAKY